LRRTTTLALIALIVAIIATPAHARGFSSRALSDMKVGTSKIELQAQMALSNRVVSIITSPRQRWKIAPRHSTCWSHVPWSNVCNRVRARLIAHRWLYRVARDRYEVLYGPCGGASAAACAWYLDGATQCEVSHEGGFTTDSNPTYKGRFQMDYGFETSTAFGKQMEALYGRASHWPASAQIDHAYEVWLSRGWGPWPPYYKFGCASYAGRSFG
jgi:hypothetical protein